MVVYLVNANLFSPGPLSLLVVLLPLISGLVSALLLRSWWTLAIAPAAYIVGEILALLVFVGVPQLWLGVYSLLLVDLLVIIGAVVGTFFGTWVEQRRQHQ